MAGDERTRRRSVAGGESGKGHDGFRQEGVCGAARAEVDDSPAQRTDLLPDSVSEIGPHDQVQRLEMQWRNLAKMRLRVEPPHARHERKIHGSALHLLEIVLRVRCLHDPRFRTAGDRGGDQGTADDRAGGLERSFGERDPYDSSMAGEDRDGQGSSEQAQTEEQG
jgi:hypothetical protein